MSDIRIERNAKLIKVLASQAKGERIDSAVSNEANEIINTMLANDMNKESIHLIAQTVAYTVDEMQKHDLDWLNVIADQKNIGYGDKAAFNVRTGHIKAFIQAKGATTSRSTIGSNQVLVETSEVAARPSINIIDLKSGRVDMADVTREASREMTNAKLKQIEKVLHTAIGGGSYSSPFYGTGTGVVKATLDAQLAYFRRLGPVTILGDSAAVSKLTGVAGMAMNTSSKNDAFMQYSDAIINEMNGNGFIGRYNGANVLEMTNAYEADMVTPVLNPNWLYLVPGALAPDMRNLKVVNEGSVNVMESTNLDDRAYDILLYQWFGAGFVVGEKPTIGAYKIN